MVRVSRESGAQEMVTSGGLVVSPSSVAIGADSRYLVSDANPFAPARIVRVDPVSGEQTTVTAAGKLIRVSGLAVFRISSSEGGVFADGEELGEGWVRSGWFGDFNRNFLDAGWLFHAQHGWMFLAPGGDPASVFLFDLSSTGWFFTGEGTYPNLFSFGQSFWIFYFEGSSGPRQLVDLQTGEFFNLP